MRIIGKSFLFFISVLAFNSCFEPPHFSVVPSLDSNPTVAFFDVPNNALSDSLTVTFNFKDGDGDLGFSQSNPADKQGKYRNTYYYNRRGERLDSIGPVTSKYITSYDKVPGGRPDTLLTYADKRNGIDTLPAFQLPYLCTRWAVIGTAPALDTVYIALNQNYYNIFVDIFVVDPSTNDLVLFNWNDPDFIQTYKQCQPQGFNSRFPILSSDISRPGPQEGTFQWSIISVGWTTNFANSILQLRVSIQDRALHRSNTVSTVRFKLADI